MSDLVYRISDLLTQLLADVPVGTNLGLFHLQFALLSGRFLPARGAVFAALDSLGLPPDAVHRASAALREGKWTLQNLLDRWRNIVASEGKFTPHEYEGVRPVAADLTAFFRPQLRGLSSRHYVSEAGKALPALVFGQCVGVGVAGQHSVRSSPSAPAAGGGRERSGFSKNGSSRKRQKRLPPTKPSSWTPASRSPTCGQRRTCASSLVSAVT